MQTKTRQWVKKAEDDHNTAHFLAANKLPLHDHVCFHCQQCAEKYLKALLQEAGLFIPKIHDCETLLDLLPPQYASVRQFSRGLAILSEYAVTVRYPGENATKRKATS